MTYEWMGFHQSTVELYKGQFMVLIGTTVYMTEWRTKYRRSMNLADNDQRTKSVDSMLNFETVKYFGAEPYEIDRYTQAILTYQASNGPDEHRGNFTPRPRTQIQVVSI